MNVKYMLLLLAAFTFSCQADEPEVEEEEPTEVLKPLAKALVDGNTFDAGEFSISTAISGETYQITASSTPQSISVFFYGLPEVKTYTLTDDISTSGASITWASDQLSSTTNHRVENGTLVVESFEDNLLKASFSGTAVKVTDPDVSVEITNGEVVARFPG